ncbi:hypothetical protein [Filifactor villosus]|uniref:Ferritin n=1 Tax=Filifactor villosus TaxID=29374 RepID=A0ABV9QNA2_9FIRM
MQYIEPVELLNEKDKAIVRALNSLVEEVEAVGYYHQRASVTDDKELKEIFLHSRNEEIEHVAMLLEWLRRNVDVFDKELKTYLFSQQNLLQKEKEEMKEIKQMKEEIVPLEATLGIGDMRQFDPEHPMDK